VVLGLGGAGPQGLDEVFRDGRGLAAEAHEARDPDDHVQQRPQNPFGRATARAL
jgi:hypothetical protein